MTGKFDELGNTEAQWKTEECMKIGRRNAEQPM